MGLLMLTSTICTAAVQTKAEDHVCRVFTLLAATNEAANFMLHLSAWTEDLEITVVKAYCNDIGLTLMITVRSRYLYL